MFSEINLLSIGSKSDRNEDCILGTQELLLVIDGASGLTETNITSAPSDSQWFSTRAVSIIHELCERRPMIDSGDVLLLASSRLLEEYKEFAMQLNRQLDFADRATFPSGALAMARQINKKVEFWCYGDCMILIMKKDGEFLIVRDQRLENLDDIVIQEMVKVSREEGISVVDSRKYVTQLLIKNRNLQNKKGGYFCFNLFLDEGVLKEAKTLTLDLQEIESVSMYSDGYLEIVHPFRVLESYAILHEKISHEGFARKLFNELYEKQESDVSCEKYPRLKLRDDSSAIFARAV